MVWLGPTQSLNPRVSPYPDPLIIPRGLGHGWGVGHQATPMRPFRCWLLLLLLLFLQNLLGKRSSLSSGIASYQYYKSGRSRCHQRERAWKRRTLSPRKVENGESVQVRETGTKFEPLTTAEPEAISTAERLIRLAKCNPFLKIV